MRLSKYLKRLANDKVRDERQQFNKFMESNGWKMYILFMRGVKWIKDDVEIIIDARGCHWNDEIISSEEMRKRVGYI